MKQKYEKITIKIINKLFKKYDLMPYYISGLMNDALCIRYRFGLKQMTMEVYNTGEIKTKVSHDKSRVTLYNEKIKKMDFRQLINEYLK